MYFKKNDIKPDEEIKKQPMAIKKVVNKNHFKEL